MRDVKKAAGLEAKRLQTLANGGSVVIFGYGFSGSGKTYALIEGSKEFSDDNDISLI